MWPFKQTITIEVNKVRNKLTEEQVKQIYLSYVDKNARLNELEAKFDEAARKAFLLAAENLTLKGQLDEARALLKNYGHPGI